VPVTVRQRPVHVSVRPPASWHSSGLLRNISPRCSGMTSSSNRKARRRQPPRRPRRSVALGAVGVRVRTTPTRPCPTFGPAPVSVRRGVVASPDRPNRVETRAIRLPSRRQAHGMCVPAEPPPSKACPRSPPPMARVRRQGEGGGRGMRLQMLRSSRSRASLCSRVCFQYLGDSSRTRSLGQSGSRIKTSRR